MNKYSFKDLQFLPSLLIIPCVYLAAWLLPWREGADDCEVFQPILSTNLEPISVVTRQELVTQQG